MQEPKRRGRPPKVRKPQTGPLPDDVARIVESAEVGQAATLSGVVHVNPRETSVIPGTTDKEDGGFISHITSELAARIRECNVVYIVCKTVNAKEVTVNHSRHDAMWLKEYV